MKFQHDMTGFALWCDLNGVIGRISRNNSKLLAHLSVGQSLTELVDEAGQNKMQNFLQTIQEQGRAFDWELNLVENAQATTFHFTGVRFPSEEVLIVLGQSSQDVMRLFEEMMRMNNEQSNQLRQVIKNQTESVRARADHDAALYNQLGQLNNELATLQRELARKNAALETTLNDLRETQAMLIHSEKMSSLGQLAAGIAHEINNPLAFIISNLQSLELATADLRGAYSELEHAIQQHGSVAQQTQAADIRQKADLDFVLADFDDLLPATLDGVKRVQKLVADLRDFSRLDEAARKTIKIEENLTSTLAIAQPHLRDKVTVHLELNSLPLIQGYPAELNQVFLNIIINAAQAIEETGQLTIRGYQENNELVLHFTDTGRGMDSNTLARVFDPFFTTKPVGTGTGLGLTIAYRIVTKMHQGNLSVSSVLNQGTTFTIRLPLDGSS